MPCSASFSMSGTIPTVETVTLRADRPKPAGEGSMIRRRALSTCFQFARGSPMPMNTTLVRRHGSPRSPRAAASIPQRTCSTISPADRLRVSPPWPVAQNGHAIPHPAWEEMHKVALSGYFMSTVSTIAPSNIHHSDLTVRPRSAVRSRTFVSSGGKKVDTRPSRSRAGRSVMRSGSTSKCSK